MKTVFKLFTNLFYLFMLFFLISCASGNEIKELIENQEDSSNISSLNDSTISSNVTITAISNTSSNEPITATLNVSVTVTSNNTINDSSFATSNTSSDEPITATLNVSVTVTSNNTINDSSLVTSNTSSDEPITATLNTQTTSTLAVTSSSESSPYYNLSESQFNEILSFTSQELSYPTYSDLHKTTCESDQCFTEFSNVTTIAGKNNSSLSISGRYTTSFVKNSNGISSFYILKDGIVHQETADITGLSIAFQTTFNLSNIELLFDIDFQYSPTSIYNKINCDGKELTSLIKSSTLLSSANKIVQYNDQTIRVVYDIYSSTINFCYSFNSVEDDLTNLSQNSTEQSTYYDPIILNQTQNEFILTFSGSKLDLSQLSIKRTVCKETNCETDFNQEDYSFSNSAGDLKVSLNKEIEFTINTNDNTDVPAKVYNQDSTVRGDISQEIHVFDLLFQNTISNYSLDLKLLFTSPLATPKQFKCDNNLIMSNYESEAIRALSETVGSRSEFEDIRFNGLNVYGLLSTENTLHFCNSVQ